jgi:hypothetical protein
MVWPGWLGQSGLGASRVVDGAMRRGLLKLQWLRSQLVAGGRPLGLFVLRFRVGANGRRLYSNGAEDAHGWPSRRLHRKLSQKWARAIC